MINQTSGNTDVDKEMLQSYKDLTESSNKLGNDIEQTLKKFEDLDAFFQKADDVVDYYFSLQSEYSKKEDFVKYLEGLLKLYVSYFSDTFEEEDDEIEDIIEHIEENYDFLLYHGENINPTYKRINDPSSGSTRKKLTESTQQRLLDLLSA